MPVTALSTGAQKVLDALSVLHYATNAQLCAYCYAPGSYAYVCAITRGLAKRGLLEVDFERRKTATGRSKSIFYLSAQARREFAERGVDLPVVRGFREHQQAHILGINEIVIAAKYFCSERGATCEQLHHDLELKRDPVVLRVNGRECRYVPDLWTTFRVGEKPWHIGWEYDRGTESEPMWREKVRLMVAFSDQGIGPRFDAETVTFAIVVNPEASMGTQKRLERLVAWTERELRERGQREWGQLFLFTTLAPDAVSARQFFVAPSWSSPFATEPQPLIVAP